MKPLRLTALALAAIASVAQAKPAGEERWRAASTTAMAITGDIRLSPTRLIAAGQTIPVTVAADLPAYRSITGVFPARVLKVTSPRRVKMLRGNEFGCNAPVRWIVVYRQGARNSLGMEVFEGPAMPRSSDDQGFCASYGYYR
ncbi:MAG: hypothetical protein ACKOPM_12230 [Novosphingobium sp.]